MPCEQKSRSHDVLVFSMETCLHIPESVLVVMTLDPLGICFNILIPTLPGLREDSLLEEDDSISSTEEISSVNAESGGRSEPGHLEWTGP